MKKLKILYLEDSPYDAEMTIATIRKAGMDFSIKLLDNEKEYRTALMEYEPDVILSDHSLYQFNSLEALKIFKESGLKVPFILVTGTVSEEFAVKILKEGADDYLLKGNLARLPNAIQNSLEKFRIDRERRQHLDNIIANQDMMKAAESLAHFGSWEADPVTGVIKWSDEMFRIYGYEPNEISISYEKFLSHVHPDEVISLKQMLENAMSELNVCKCEFRIIDRNGNMKYISNRILIDRNSQNKPVRLRGFNQDITKRKEAEAKLLETVKELAKVERELAEEKLTQQRMLTEITIQAQEREREELARELHDNINQVLASAKMYLNMASGDKKRTVELVKRSYDNVTYAVEEIRKLCKSLIAPSLGDMGLNEALQGLVEEVNLTRQIHVALSFQKKAASKLDARMELMLYRIVQEQLNNIIKHARASKAAVELKSDAGSVILLIKDNGVGFDPSKKPTGIGLKNIRSRVEFYSGQLHLESAPGKGCSLEIIIPV